MSLSYVSIKNKNLEIELSEDNVNNSIETLGIPLKYRAEINDKTLDIYVYTKLIDCIDTYYKFTFSLDSEDGNISLKLLSSKLGKLNISKKKVLENINLSNYNKDVIIEINNKRIIFTNDILYINEFEIKNGIVFLKCTLDSSEIDDVIKSGIENIINIFR